MEHFAGDYRGGYGNPEANNPRREEFRGGTRPYREGRSNKKYKRRGPKLDMSIRVRIDHLMQHLEATHQMHLLEGLEREHLEREMSLGRMPSRLNDIWRGLKKKILAGESGAYPAVPHDVTSCDPHESDAVDPRYQAIMEQAMSFSGPDRRDRASPSPPSDLGPAPTGTQGPHGPGPHGPGPHGPGPHGPGSHGQGPHAEGPHAEGPPGCQGGREAGRVVPPLGSPTPQPVQTVVKWLEPKDVEFGHFFINKLFLDPERTSFWKPRHFVDCLTEVCSLPDLVSGSDLEKVLIVEPRFWSSFLEDNALGSLPKSADVTVVCAEDEQPSPRPEDDHQMVPCDQCKVKEGDHIASAPSGECDKCTKVKVVKVHNGSYSLRCRLMILRFKLRVRIVIVSASFSQLEWEKMGQFGWYCDLSVITSWGALASAELSEFQVDLETLVSNLGVDPGEFLSGCDYSKLHPCLKLVTCIPGSYSDQDIRQHGAYKLEDIQSKLNWPSNTKKQAVYQTCRLSSPFSRDTAKVLQMVFNLWLPMNHPVTGIDVVYPSRTYVDNAVRKFSLSQKHVDKVFVNRDRQFFMAPYLRDMDCTEGILSTANVLTQHVVMPHDTVPDLTSKYGWLLTGSAALGQVDWGALAVGNRRNARGNDVKRFSLSVGIFPVLEQLTESTAVVQCLDLAQIGLLYQRPEPHPATAGAFTPAATPGAVMYHCLGPLARVVSRSGPPFGFVDPFPEGHPLHSATCGDMSTVYPPSQSRDHGRPSRFSAFVHENTCILSGLSRLPPAGTILQFFAMFDQDRFRIGRVVKVFTSEKAALEHFNITVDPKAFSGESWRREGAVTPPDGRIVNQPKPPADRAPPRDRPEREEDFEERMEKEFEKRRNNMIRQFVPTEADLERRWPMNPTKMSGDLEWLEKHVTRVCGGHFPKHTVGAYSFQVQDAFICATRRRLCPGLDWL